jgi:hypothetical protein
MMSVLQDVISWRSYLLLVCVLLAITSLISAGHHLEDEVKHSAMFGLILNDFSVRENVDEFFYPKMVHLEYQNRKLLLTILTNTTRPISLKFTDGLIVNNTLFVFVSIIW